MKEHSINSTDTFIAGWYIDPLLCNSIVERGESDVDKFIAWTPWYQHYDLKDFDNSLCQQYEKALHDTIEKYKELYPLCYEKLHPWGWTPPRIQRYNPGQYFNTLHCENDGTVGTLQRHFAYMTYLNDVAVGGGTEFLHQNIVTPAETGLTLIWPAQWTHHHRGVVAPTEVKYIITGWLCFQPDPTPTIRQVS
jgi:hypothetical protein